MKKQAVSFVAVCLGLVAASGCSKSNSPTFLGQLNPPPSDPAPAPSTNPIPSPVPSPSPSPRPSPSPTPPPSSPNPNPSPIACDPAAFKPFLNQSSFSLSTALFQGMNVSHGVAAPTITLDGVDLGYGLERDGGRYDVVGDQVKVSYVDIENGGVAYGSKIKYGESVDVFGVVKKASPVNYAAARELLTDLQLKMVDLPVNGAVTVACADDQTCKVTLKGTNPTVNRFTLSDAQLANAFKKGSKVIVDVPKHATAVVMMNAQTVHFEDLEVKAPPETIWTLGKRGGVFTIDFMSLTGTVFLLDSTFNMDQALLMGRVISKSFTSTECSDDNGDCSTIDSQEMPDNVCL